MSKADLASKLLAFVPLSVRRHIKDVPGIGSLQRHIVSRLLDGREFTYTVDAGPAKGVSFVIRLPEDKGIWTGTYEFAFARHLAAAVRSDTIGYDIGGWHGFFAGVMAANGARQVHVFEPLPGNAERIRKMIALNADKPITVHRVAVGETDTQMDLLVLPETSMAKLAASGFQPDAAPHERVRVCVTSLDTILQSGAAPPPSLLKIDVEGAELLVLRGARATLRAHRPEIFAEIHSQELLQQCSALLVAEGYRISRLEPNPGAPLAKDICQIHAVAQTAS